MTEAAGQTLAVLLRRWRCAALPILQSALAAGLAWLVAVHVVDHRVPFFAPIAAIVCLGVTLGQRLRRGVELVAGVTIGIGVGDLLIHLIGTGAWQITLVVALAMSAAVLVDGGPIITMQSAVSAILVATLYLPGQTSGATRMVDALIGGLVALAVAAAIPGDPVSVALRQARRVLGELARALHDAAETIRERAPDRVPASLARARAAEHMVDDFRTALATAQEIALIAPSRWRVRRRLQPYVALAAPVEAALQNAGVLVRRIGGALRDGEEMPAALQEALDALAEAVDLLAKELAEGDGTERSRARLRELARSAGENVVGAGGFSTRVVLAQLRSIVLDLLEATGVPRNEAIALLPAAPTIHIGATVMAAASGGG